MLANTSQILERNLGLLEAKNPLWVNIPADNFLQIYQQTYPDAKLSCLHFDLAIQQQLKAALTQLPVNFHFTVEYQAKQKHDLVVIQFPKAKAELIFTLAMLASQLTDDATIVFVGENKSGIKSVAKQAKDYVQYCIKQDNARHCLLFSARSIRSQKTFNLTDWFNYYSIDVQGQKLSIAALPGVFSQQKLDIGTRVLLQNLPEPLAGKVLDFGCGAGVIASVIGKLYPALELTLVDVNALAVASSQQTLACNQLTGQVIASDGLAELKADRQFDYILSNPPFHQGLKTYYAATEQFLAQAKHYLTPKGELRLVANNFLEYEALLNQHFTQLTNVCEQQGFKILQAKL